jgi:hypothetical protein
MVVTSEFTFYVGVDWATEHHQVCISDCDGRVVRQQRIKHSGKAITDFMASMEDLAQFTPAGSVHRFPIAIDKTVGSPFLRRSHPKLPPNWRVKAIHA